jgi:hypothetical protein
MTKRRRFAPGRLTVTTHVQLHVTRKEILAALRRHLRGDWGELDLQDHQSNEAALRDGARLLSAYRTKRGVRFWVVTEWDRSATTVLVPADD